MVLTYGWMEPSELLREAEYQLDTLDIIDKELVMALVALARALLDNERDVVLDVGA